LTALGHTRSAKDKGFETCISRYPELCAVLHEFAVAARSNSPSSAAVAAASTTAASKFGALMMIRPAIVHFEARCSNVISPLGGHTFQSITLEKNQPRYRFLLGTQRVQSLDTEDLKRIAILNEKSIGIAVYDSATKKNINVVCGKSTQYNV
jgi:hypothetical protein